MIRTAPKQTIRYVMQHYMNGLHIYSLMCRLKMGKQKALKTAKAYERFVHPLLY